MALTPLQRVLKKKLPILFVYIGWSRHYDGTETVKGTHGWLKTNPDDSSEGRAFIRDAEGRYVCGVGRGRDSPSPVHVVFVARDPSDGKRKAVGVYAAAELEEVNSWSVARAKRAMLFLTTRPTITAWAGDSGMRRWASREGTRGREHRELIQSFRRVVARCGASTPVRPRASVDAELEFLEGRVRKRLVIHRGREARLRVQKIMQRLRVDGRLRCEVPGCGFDFLKRYGELGRGYAQVHHLRSLSSADRGGTRTSLKDLAIVCANCHAMIHRGGECRKLRALLKHRKAVR